jgi:hypothetical protein
MRGGCVEALQKEIGFNKLNQDEVGVSFTEKYYTHSQVHTPWGGSKTTIRSKIQ